MEYNPETPEQVIKLSNGREIFKTHNGFKCYLKDKHQKVTAVAQEYYTKLKRSNK